MFLYCFLFEINLPLSDQCVSVMHVGLSVDEFISRDMSFLLLCCQMSDAYVPLHHTAGGSSTPASPAVMDSGVRVNIKRRVVADSPAHVSSVRTGGGNGGGSGRRVPDSLLLGWLLVTGALLAAVLWLALVGRDKNDSDQNDWTPPVLTVGASTCVLA